MTPSAPTDADDDRHPARLAWTVIEPLHAVTYFAPSVRAATEQAGLRGFWMGYFAQRCAPMGPISAEVATAVCHGFAPSRIARALPDAWERMAPAEVVSLRRRAAADALVEIVDGVEVLAEQVVPLLVAVVRAASPAGRPLFAANKALALPDDPVEALWQLATALREHRGDGHVAALVSHDVGAVECHLLATADPDDREQRRVSRGWTEEEWRGALDRLTSRGLLEEGLPTEAGSATSRSIERATDTAAWRAWNDGLTPEGIGLVMRLLGPPAASVWRSGLLTVPNPMGLDPP